MKGRHLQHYLGILDTLERELPERTQQEIDALTKGFGTPPSEEYIQHFQAKLLLMLSFARLLAPHFSRWEMDPMPENTLSVRWNYVEHGFKFSPPAVIITYTAVGLYHWDSPASRLNINKTLKVLGFPAIKWDKDFTTPSFKEPTDNWSLSFNDFLHFWELKRKATP